ncbi:type VI secretion system protein [Pseudomonas sp. CAU 1711]|uniref:type VI secretion system protein n=1 Tax=Pseudomonas sp. CAU 1711 TaxID=3140356 RepID=UPI0032611953
MSVLEIVFLLVGLIVLALLLGVLFWWLRDRFDQSARSCFLAVQQMESDLGLKERYQIPWLLLIGDEQRTERLCRAWRLSSSGKPGWFGRWWYDSDAALLAAPNAMFNHGEGALLQIAAWRRLLGMLLMMRAGRPLDAIIWTVPAEQLWDSEDAMAAGLAARRKFNELLQHLGLSLPVYVLVTGLESQPGIKELADMLPADARERMLGWSSPFAPGTTWHPEWTEMALDRLVRVLEEEITELGALSGRVEEALYLLPRRFDAIRNNLQTLCDPVFHGSAIGEAAQLRGIYFCADLPSQARDDDPFVIGDETTYQPLFSSRLLRQRILADQGLAQPVPRILYLRRRWLRLSGGVAGVVALLWLVGMLWVWQVEKQQAVQLSALLQELRRYEANGTEDTKRSIEDFWTLLAEAPRWRFSSALLPGSLFSSLDERLGERLLQATSKELYLPLRGILERDLQALSTQPQQQASRPSTEAGFPEQWPAYLQATQLLQKAQTLESNGQRFNQMLAGSKKPLDDAMLLADALLGLELQSQPLPLQGRYNRLLANTPQPLASPLNLSAAQPEIAKLFVRLMQQWLDQLFADADFTGTASEIKRHLQLLENGQRNSILELEELSLDIDRMGRLVSALNLAWGRGSGDDLVPGYTDMLEAAGKNGLIGQQAVAQVKAHASRLRNIFSRQWLNDDDPHTSVLRRQNGGIELQDNLTKLDTAIAVLLRQDFATAALAGGGTLQVGGPLSGIDEQSLTSAQSYFAHYGQYLKQDIARVPFEYRGALTGAAQDSTAITMWNLLATPRPSTSLAQSDGRVFNLSVDSANAVFAAFQALGRQDLAQALLREMNRRALQDLDRADAELQRLGLYQPQQGDFSWWNGNTNVGLRAYHAGNLQELQQYLSGQVNLIADLQSRIAPAMAWLDSHSDSLAAGNLARLRSWQDMAVELKRYADKNPNSAPALFERFAAGSLNDMDLTTCSTRLHEAQLPDGADAISQRARSVAELVSQRCSQLQLHTAAAAWNTLSGFFNQYLAGRFPFAFDVEAVDADPDRVRQFLHLLDENLEQARAGLSLAQSPDALAAASFLDQLQQAKVWLTPLFLRNQDGIRGLDLDVRWRTDRDAEQGADQVIEWSLAAGSELIRYPGGEQSRLRWGLAQPVKLLLRWAMNGSQRPADDPQQLALAVYQYEAGWEYDGPWALLRLLRNHVAFERLTTIDYNETPLAFRVPVYAPGSSDNQAQMFVRLTLLSAGGKQPLAMSPLPVGAPKSPFVTPPQIGAQASIQPVAAPAAQLPSP